MNYQHNLLIIKQLEVQKMFILDNENQLERAIAKAKKVRTQVKFIAFGIYSVRGTKGNFYTVKCERMANGEKQVSCECLGAEKGLVCFHAASALSLHVGLARQRQTESV
jgi:hypothetical protein